MLSLLLGQSLLSSANAFCGTYVGGVGAELYNSYSQLAVVRDDNETTLTIVNNVEGNFDNFALVLPVPKSFQKTILMFLIQPFSIDWMLTLNLV